MNRIIDNLYISSFELARDEKLIKKIGIVRILSLGCEYIDDDCRNLFVENDNNQNQDIHYKMTNIEYLNFPNILDTPETSLLPILYTSNKFIHFSLTTNQNILVHCQYGQSRSVAIIIMYLLCTGKYNLEESLLLFNRNHPNISINPGFLSQIYFLSQVESLNSPISYLFNFNSYNDKLVYDYHDQSIKASANVDGLFCKNCKSFLNKRDNIIHSSIKTSDFVHKYLDLFWKGYQVTSNGDNIIVLPSKKIIAVAPSAWMLRTVNNSSSKNNFMTSIDLKCPVCDISCGYWSKNTLNIIGEYCLADLYAFYEANILIKKERRL